MDYASFQHPAYLGRGKVQFTAPLLVNGQVNPQGYGARWGENWGALPATPGELQLPPGRFVGNAKGMELLPLVDRANVSAWNTSNSLIVQGIDLALTLYGYGAQNLADGLHARRSQAVAAARTETIATGRANIEAGGMLFTRTLIDTALPIAVTPSWATWTENIDWAREAFGIRLLGGFSGPVGSTITLAYTPEGGAEQLEALAAGGQELGISFTGTNRADGSPVRLDVYRATPLLSDPLRPISDEAGTVTLKFQLKPALALPDMRPRWYRVLRGRGANL